MDDHGVSAQVLAEVSAARAHGASREPSVVGEARRGHIDATARRHARHLFIDQSRLFF